LKYALAILMVLAVPAAAQNMSNYGTGSPGIKERLERERKLQRCMVDLTTITDQDFRRWCEAQSKRLP
jgi:hypothetical protein